MSMSVKRTDDVSDRDCIGDIKKEDIAPRSVEHYRHRHETPDQLVVSRLVVREPARLVRLLLLLMPVLLSGRP